jgi:hypothetical protein
MRFSAPGAGGSGVFGGAPELGWRFVSVAESAATQSTLLSSSFSDQASNEIRCTVASGANNAGAIESAGYMLFPLVDTRGRSVTPTTPCLVEVEVIPVTAPANATFPYFVAGVTSKTTTTAFNASPNFMLGGINYQPVANPRGHYFVRVSGGVLNTLAIGTGSAIGTSGGRFYIQTEMVRTTTYITYMTATGFDASNTTIVGAPYNIAASMDAGATALRLIVAAGSFGGALAANTTLGCKVRYRVHRLVEEA